jgi:hypothetical protein
MLSSEWLWKQIPGSDVDEMVQALSGMRGIVRKRPRHSA